MPLSIPQDWPSVGRTIAEFWRSGSTIREAVAQKLLEASASPSAVDRSVAMVETLYAARDELDKPARDLAAQLAGHLVIMPHAGAVRFRAISGALQRVGGYAAPEGTAWPQAADDPEPVESYIVAPDEVEE